MSLQYIIDGYNLINHPLFVKCSNKKIQDKRAALINLIKTDRLTGSRENQVTIVFDGYSNLQDLNRLSSESREINIVFSKKDSADEKIKSLVESCGRPKSIIVVSDDRQLQSIVKSFNAGVIGVEEFIGRREKLKKNTADNESETKVNYTQMQRINQELRGLWLKQ